MALFKCIHLNKATY